MLESYFKSLYQRTMSEAYAKAEAEILKAMQSGGRCLDCGAGKGDRHTIFSDMPSPNTPEYYGVEWNQELVTSAQKRGIQVSRADLNTKLDFSDNYFDCIFGLSVLEHLLYPCRYLKDTHRCLKKNGTLVLLTPNISTFFTIALLLAGKMPSSGPHPDSDSLLKTEELFKVSSETLVTDAENDFPEHRHLIIFSFRVLRAYLHTLGFKDVRGCGFGLYPFPNFAQPLLERIDPYHCHQMVFIAKK